MSNKKNYPPTDDLHSQLMSSWQKVERWPEWKKNAFPPTDAELKQEKSKQKRQAG